MGDIKGRGRVNLFIFLRYVLYDLQWFSFILCWGGAGGAVAAVLSVG